MAILIATTSDVIKYGTAVSSDSVEQTVLALVYLTAFNANDHLIASKSDGAGFTVYRDFIVTGTGGTSGRMLLEARRATTALRATSTSAVISINEWTWLAFQLNTAGVNADQKLFYAKDGSKLTEVASYSTQQVGSGSVFSDAAFQFALGNSDTPQTFWGQTGITAMFTTWSRALTLKELNDIIEARSIDIEDPTLELYTVPGTNLGVQFDYSKKGRHGVVTGATPTAGDVYSLTSPDPAYLDNIPYSAATAYTLTASAGSFALTGTAASLIKGPHISAAAGSYTLTGNSVGLFKGRTMAAGSASFSFTGNDVVFGRTANANLGSYAFTGNNANLLWKRILPATAGSYALSGNSVTLTKGSVGSYTLIATAGSFGLTGKRPVCCGSAISHRRRGLTSSLEIRRRSTELAR
jgi:hypothetical protein